MSSVYSSDSSDESNQLSYVVKKSRRGRNIQKRKEIPIEVILGFESRDHPNMSKKKYGNKLYPFPSFDKGDSLLFFPTTFTSYMNSGDMLGLSRLLHSRVDRNCSFSVSGINMDSVETLARAFQFTNEIHPDSVMAVHQTKVIDNQICATMYYKYTDSKLLRDQLARTMVDPTLLELCPAPRVDMEALDSYLESQPEAIQSSLSELIYSAEDIVVYGTAKMALTYNDCNKKITRIEMYCDFSSFTAVPVQL